MKNASFSSKLFFILLLCIVPLTTYAQSKKVSGHVTDDLGEPLIGLLVQEMGTNNGVVTDVNGNYSIYNIADENSVIKSLTSATKLRRSRSASNRPLTSR